MISDFEVVEDKVGSLDGFVEDRGDVQVGKVGVGGKNLKINILIKKMECVYNNIYIATLLNYYYYNFE